MLVEWERSIARDTRLGRDVAIKILPTHLSSDPELKQRFEREARAVSSLTHPNICCLYDIGLQDGIDFIVMEYLEGETLAVRLSRGPLPLALCLKMGVEIADALDKAHPEEIVHRDLKPGNILLTKSGAKLMDFGLARSVTATLPGVTPAAIPSKGCLWPWRSTPRGTNRPQAFPTHFSRRELSQRAQYYSNMLSTAMATASSSTRCPLSYLLL